jgi:beta-galactosidase
MKKLLTFCVCVLIMPIFIYGTSFSSKEKAAVSNRTISFDENWHFIKDNPAGAETPGFDDSGWRTLDLPHDWSIEDLPNQDGVNVVGPFSKASLGKMYTGYMVGGTAWYRKHFTIDKASKDKRAYLQFDGIYMNSDVWINGKHVGNHLSGYTSFWYDITPYLNPAGETNIVAVQVKNELYNARWYSGSGIYRHTWLTLANPVHVAPWGVYITTTKATEKKANVEVVTNVTNSDGKNLSVSYTVRLIDPTGKEVGKSTMESSVPSGKSIELKQVVQVENPVLWSLEEPTLYQAQVELTVNKKIEDKVITAFGIRTIHFDTETGFTLNGKSIELKGGCFHHDNGPLGAVAIDRAEERKIEVLKKAGFNAVRTSHNTMSQEILNVCDKLGMLVLDELFDSWEISKIGNVYKWFGTKGVNYIIEDYSKYFKENWRKDIQSTITRDRNHPSVIMWSIGNEISEASDTSGNRIGANLVNEIKKYDRTRPVTEGNVDAGAAFGGRLTWDQRAPHMTLLDVVGYNYGYARYIGDHKKHPERIMYGSETGTASFEDWKMIEDLPYVFGNFCWTAMDYMGESGIGIPRYIPDTTKFGAGMGSIMLMYNPESWPVFNAFCGQLDIIGNPKPASYLQRVIWRESKVEMFVHRPIPAHMKNIGRPDLLRCWTWPGHEGENLKVYVYSRSQLVKLELNGKIIGEQTIDDKKTVTTIFDVPYEAGTLIARCYDNGVETGSQTIKTFGKPAAIRLSADRSTIKADRNDLSYVMVEITDAEGNLITNTDDIIVNFEISGNGKIAGIGNGSFSDVSSCQQPRKKTWQGRCLIILRPKGEAGKIVLTARAEGLKEALIEIVTRK